MAQTLTTLDHQIMFNALDAVRRGEFSVRLPLNWEGLDGKIADAFNDIVSMEEKLAKEIERVTFAVGTEGKLGQRMKLDKSDGAWDIKVESINTLIENMAQPIRDTGRVMGAVARGVLNLSMELEIEGRALKGEFLKNAKTINIMVDQLNAFAGEVTRVAREVGTEGKLCGQAQVQGVSGVWKDLTDNVNLMAGNLTGQVRNIAGVTTAVATGDLSQKITVDVKGEILELKNTINIMVDQLNAFAGEVTRVAREVGTEGKLGGQAQVKGISGVWKDLTDSVNAMAGNLTAQVRNIAGVTTAVAKGDLSQKITVDVRGEVLQLKDTINIMVDQLNAFAGEVTRVAREVGTEGKLGGQAQVQGVSGVWKDLTDNVNLMAGNLTGQVRNIAGVTTAVATGDLSQKITVDVKGEILELKNTINIMVDQLNAFAGEVTRVAREVGTEGKLGGQAQVKGVSGVWQNLTDNVNLMASNLTGQVRNIAGVTTAVAKGDLSQKITVDVRGEVLQLKDTINTMVDQLNAFAGEVTRVAREVGTEGKLGGQAQVKGVSGVWKDLTDSVNVMADNLTDQVRGIAKVVTGVAVGNLKQKMMVPAKGEVASLADIINDMMDTLATFSDQVTRVAREVGVEGKLGGQATVPGAAGSWKDLVDNVNELAANLTTQVRAIGEVAIAVTKGDLTRSIQVAASGEVADLKDNVNQMILNLKETTQRNTEQDWLKTNLARLIRMLQGQRDTMTVARTLLSELAPLVAAQHAVLYTLQAQAGATWLRLMSSYGYQERKNLSQEWAIGEGLVGQAAFEKQRILVSHVPDDYIQIVSGLGQATPRNLIVLPILFEGQLKAVIELATFEPFQGIHLTLLDQLAEGLGIVFNSIESAASTEALLQQSQSLANELKSQQDELQNTNAELQQKALQLIAQNAEVERKNREIEVARASLQEQASQLGLTSKYKSEFLANMSHELRTPLNSLLLLADQLNQNRGGNLTPQQTEMIEIIHGSGSDLLQLINDILDLSKIEAGSTTLEPEDLPFARLADHVDNTFRHLAEAKGLEFTLDLAPDLPPCVHADEQRLQQVLKNLIANAIKFTERGSVTFKIGVARSGWSREHKLLNSAPMVIAFAVIDTGMGIPKDKRMLIFEAFQQADAGTSRRYGGTGLGLAISREIARLLDGELRVESEEGIGSTFTFYLPQQIPGGLRMKPRLSPETVPTALLGERSMAGPAPTQAATSDDRGAVGLQDDVLLIIEDDPTFAQVLREMAHGHGFKALVATSGGEGIGLAQQFKAAAIILDIILPDIDGWSVADRLKAHPETRDIPIHVISVRDRPAAAEMKGVASYLTKPLDTASLRQVFAQITQEVARPARALLIIERDPARRAAILAELKGEAVDLVSVASASETLAELRSRPYQGVVLDLDVPEMDGIALLQDMRQDPALADIPVVTFTGRSLDRKEKNRFKQLGAMVIAGEGESALNRLAAGVKQFLQGLKGEKPEKAKPEQTELPALSNGLLAGKKALLVDDDIRNLFALTAVLESSGIVVVPAESGKDAIARLHDTPGIDIVLMDIMMPHMDGYETMRRIRSEPQFKDLAIIALTAKAMKGDREKCLEAGASDYASKPVDMEKLLAQLGVLLNAWLLL